MKIGGQELLFGMTSKAVRFIRNTVYNAILGAELTEFIQEPKYIENFRTVYRKIEPTKKRFFHSQRHET